MLPTGGLTLLCPMAAGTGYKEGGLGWLSLEAPSHTGTQWESEQPGVLGIWVRLGVLACLFSFLTSFKI